MTRVVFSTEAGKICPECQQPIKQCCCQQLKNSTPLGDGIVRIQRETKGRKGKGVTLITGLPLNAKELKILAKELKQRCSTGGAVKDGVVEIQGDQRELIKTLLTDKGYQVKLSGG
ncbi:translation initiation factor Sui1 [Dasania marina]|uniref:translation initiation factor Sui1 n=1 Tax=Dasania marina TaxID=471499 RepID=UPI0030D72286|tara:strand:+ start:96661 stop:97008 length:348 start_codon:yes stop_codon:yes gene_type:complete